MAGRGTQAAREAQFVPPCDEAPEDYVPRSADELAWCLQSWRWRIYSGRLYKIMTKADEYHDGSVIPFRPNVAQRQFAENMHYRNVILKARQLGCTTLIAILWLDHAMWVRDQRVGIIAHSLDDAAVIFRDKVLFAYRNLPEEIRAICPLRRESAFELVFAHNNSAIRVATSMRSGTIHRLHISEMGKIAAKFPQKAVEIVTGSLPAVPAHGVAVIESTAEGRAGEFYEIASRAERRNEINRPLAPSEWRFHFFPWHVMPEYRATRGDETPITATDHEYFDAIEAEMGCKLDLDQRRWYVGKREQDMSGDAEKMWREYPSTPGECWRRTTEGTFFAPQLARARAEGRIGRVPFVSNVPVHTFWDIGAGDGTAIWLMQLVGVTHRFPLFIEGWGEGYAHYVRRLRETGQVFGRHYLPHDADHQRQDYNRVASPRQMLQEAAPDWSFQIVQRTQTLQHGIDLLRTKFQEAWFDEEGCREGLEHLELYHKKWNARLGLWSDEPEKLDGHSEASDALRQWAQGFDAATALHSPYAAIKRMRRRQPAGGLAL